MEGDVAMTAFVLAALGECKCGGVVCEQDYLKSNKSLVYRTLDNSADSEQRKK